MKRQRNQLEPGEIVETECDARFLTQNSASSGRRFVRGHKTSSRDGHSHRGRSHREGYQRNRPLKVCPTCRTERCRGNQCSTCHKKKGLHKRSKSAEQPQPRKKKWKTSTPEKPEMKSPPTTPFEMSSVVGDIGRDSDATVDYRSDVGCDSDATVGYGGVDVGVDDGVVGDDEYEQDFSD